MKFLRMKGSYQYRYELFFKIFVSQFSVGNNQKLKTIITETYVLSNHRLDPKLYEKKIEKHSRDKARNYNEVEISTAETFDKKYTMCYCCEQISNIVPYYSRIKPTSKDKWNVKISMKNMQGSVDDS